MRQPNEWMVLNRLVVVKLADEADACIATNLDAAME